MPLGSPSGGTSGRYAPVDPATEIEVEAQPNMPEITPSRNSSSGGAKLMCARIIGWLCGLNLLLLGVDTAQTFLFNSAAPLGALDVVADHADMAMDEGEQNSTGIRAELKELRTTVELNKEAIEVRLAHRSTSCAPYPSRALLSGRICARSWPRSRAPRARAAREATGTAEARTRRRAKVVASSMRARAAASTVGRGRASRVTGTSHRPNRKRRWRAKATRLFDSTAKKCDRACGVWC